MRYRYSDLITLYPNLAPNSRSPNYRKIKRLYDNRVENVATLEDSLHVFLRVLNESASTN
jgi:hypothetical protein